MLALPFRLSSTKLRIIVKGRGRLLVALGSDNVSLPVIGLSSHPTLASLPHWSPLLWGGRWSASMP